MMDEMVMAATKMKQSKPSMSTSCQATQQMTVVVG
jgi:hypothetical protein